MRELGAADDGKSIRWVGWFSNCYAKPDRTQPEADMEKWYLYMETIKSISYVFYSSFLKKYHFLYFLLVTLQVSPNIQKKLN